MDYPYTMVPGGFAVGNLSELEEEIKACQACTLCKSRVKSVPGEGSEEATVMFIGEAPGFHENQQGRPFVGAAGQFLDQLLASIGLDRSKVFIANVVKCRPPNNRDPLPEEIAACKHYLDRQIEIIKPKIIVTLGRFSMARYFPGVLISKVHGQPKRENGIVYFPMFHPAAALHRGDLRPVVEADMMKITKLLEELEDLPEVDRKSVV
jgi:uracil-DNA glycosylase